MRRKVADKRTAGKSGICHQQEITRKDAGMFEDAGRKLSGMVKIPTVSGKGHKEEYHIEAYRKFLKKEFAEIFAALALEREYSKEQLFEIYVNTIYFGSGYYGIYEAAQGYYGKNPSELTDYEAIMLAGIPNAPSNYSPDASMELARKRMSLVLEKMVNCRKITETRANEILGNANK